ncbi:MAG TPA: hypothetical protein VFU41_01490 [Gemmatimonadales bacterium]|nr:hypothetical protein [Gemmatimonadales bacterium]
MTPHLSHRLRIQFAGLTALLFAGVLGGCNNDGGSGPPPPPRVAVLNQPISANRTLYTDTVYTLSGHVKVQSGVTLTIQPGTTILGDTTQPSSLWILRGAKIIANGTAAAPIVFTSARAVGNRKPGDWGGIVIIGNGLINRTGVVNTEGPVGVAENYGGGTNNTDSSGVLRYVRIEFAGFDVTGTASELNGLSMYAVGSKTVLEYVEVLAGLDDSFEWWGGAVDGRHLVSYEAGDDHFDWSEGYVGRVQFAIGLQAARLTPAAGSGFPSTDPQGFEADGCAGTGCTGPAGGHRSTPYSDPVFANLTMVGSGTVETQTSGGFGAVLRRGTKGLLHNGIIARWKGTGISVRDSATGNILDADSLNLHNMVFAQNTGTGGDYDPAGTNFGQGTKFAADNHRSAATAAALFANLTPTGLNWTPQGIAASGCGTVALPAARAANFFGGTMPNTAYCGAVDPAGPQWYQGWTVYLTN